MLCILSKYLQNSTGMMTLLFNLYIIIVWALECVNCLM